MTFVRWLSLNHTNGMSWIRTTESSWWRTNETSLGVSFETCLRHREGVPIRRLYYVPLRRCTTFLRHSYYWDVLATIETSLGVSFETHLRRRWDVQREVVTTSPRRAARWEHATNKAIGKTFCSEWQRRAFLFTLVKSIPLIYLREKGAK